MSAPEVVANLSRAAEIVGGGELLARMQEAGWVTELPCSTRKVPLFAVESLVLAACKLVKGETLPPLKRRKVEREGAWS